MTLFYFSIVGNHRLLFYVGPPEKEESDREFVAVLLPLKLTPSAQSRRGNELIWGISSEREYLFPLCRHPSQSGAKGSLVTRQVPSEIGASNLRLFYHSRYAF